METQKNVAWSSEQFRMLIMTILHYLEPKEICNDEILLDIDEEIADIMFVMNANIRIGYAPDYF